MFQIFISSDDASFTSRLTDTIRQKAQEREIDSKELKVLNIDDFADLNFDSNYPAAAVIFQSDWAPGDRAKSNLRHLKANSAVILPVIEKIDDPYPLLYEELEAIQHIQTYIPAKEEAFAKITNSIFEGLGLIRAQKRVFISYRRAEALDIADQLAIELRRHGFGTFLDTWDVQSGDDFQEYLLHQLSNSDVLLALESPSFFMGKYSRIEIEQAQAMSVGVVQVVWPGEDVSRHRNSHLNAFFSLEESHFDGGRQGNEQDRLIQTALKSVVDKIEETRIKNHVTRLRGLTGELELECDTQNVPYVNVWNRYLLTNPDSKYTKMIVPMVGVPTSNHYHTSFDLRNEHSAVNEIAMLFNELNILRKWREHIVWLDQFLPVKSLKHTQVKEWLKTNFP